MQPITVTEIDNLLNCVLLIIVTEIHKLMYLNHLHILQLYSRSGPTIKLYKAIIFVLPKACLGANISLLM